MYSHICALPLHGSSGCSHTPTANTLKYFWGFMIFCFSANTGNENSDFFWERSQGVYGFAPDLVPEMLNPTRGTLEKQCRKRSPAKESRKNVMKKVTETSGKVTKKWPKLKRKGGTLRFPPSKTLHTLKMLGELMFGSLHKFHVIHCASRSYTWKADFFSVIHGVGHYIEKFGELIFGVMT